MEVYNPPKTDLSGSENLKIGVWRKIVAVILIALSSALFLWIVSILPMYEGLFSDFGSELPAATLFMLKSTGILLGLVALNLVAYLLLYLPVKYKIKLLAFRYCVASIFVSVIVFGFLQWAVSLPFVQMSEAL
jgi:type II secretory pathway component PulF